MHESFGNVGGIGNLPLIGQLNQLKFPSLDQDNTCIRPLQYSSTHFCRHCLPPLPAAINKYHAVYQTRFLIIYVQCRHCHLRLQTLQTPNTAIPAANTGLSHPLVCNTSTYQAAVHQRQRIPTPPEQHKNKISSTCLKYA